jgi:DNA-directed RNA polymerase I, II, and III subunit RPABC2
MSDYDSDAASTNSDASEPPIAIKRSVPGAPIGGAKKSAAASAAAAAVKNATANDSDDDYAGVSDSDIETEDEDDDEVDLAEDDDFAAARKKRAAATAAAARSGAAADDSDYEDADLEDEDDIEVAPDEDDEAPPTAAKTRGSGAAAARFEAIFDDESDDDEAPATAARENYLMKIDEQMRNNIITDYHPELMQHSYDEIKVLCSVVRDEDGVICDPLHKTIPILTKYEKTRIIGERARQINSGSAPMVEVPEGMIDGYLIALRELEEKKIPFIVKRPIGNGCEYWFLADLEVL